MSKMTMNRLGFFAAGTFFGGYVLSLFGSLLGRKG